MTSLILTALLASIPLAALAWSAGVLAERLGAGLRLRGLFWAVALLIPVLLTPAVLVVKAADVRSPLALEMVTAPVLTQVFAELAVKPAAPAPATIEPTPTAPLQLPPLGPFILGLLVLGALIRGSVLAIRLRRLHRAATAARPFGASGGLPVRIGGDHGPLLAGWLRPVVLLPERMAYSLTPERLDHIRAHEAAHARRGDQWRTLAEEVLLAAFWFNPPLAAIRARLAAAREESCDQAVLNAAPSSERRAYAESLIEALRAASTQPAAAFTGFRRAQAVRRLRAILHPQAAGRWAARVAAPVLGVGLVSTTGALSLAFAAQAPVVQTLLAAPVAAARAAILPEPVAAMAPLPVAATSIRLEYRLVTGAGALFQKVLSAPRQDEIGFTTLSSLTSTYGGAPVALSGPLDQTLTGFSRNELTAKAVPGQLVAAGGEAVLDDLTLYAGSARQATETHWDNGGITVSMGPARSEADDQARKAAVIMTMQVSRTGGRPLTRVAIRPSVNANGRVRLVLDVRSNFEARPELRATRDGDKMRVEVTGRTEPGFDNHRAGVLELAPGEVAAVRWSTARGGGARDTGAILLIRAVAEPAPRLAFNGPAD